MTDPSDGINDLLTGLASNAYTVSDIYARNNRLTIFAASSTGVGSHYDYPYKLEKYPGSEAIRDTCVELVIDSNIHDPSVTNADILERAYDRRADYVVAKDYPGKPHKTAESLREFLEIYEENGDVYGHITPIAPIQPPHRETYTQYEGIYEEFPILGVGGLRTETPHRQLTAVKNLREVASTQSIHGFGMGGTLDFVKTVRDNPGLIDSVDLSTPERSAKNGTELNALLNQTESRVPHGESSSELRSVTAERNLLVLNYLYSDLVDDEEIESVWKSVFQNQTLASFSQEELLA